MLTAKVPIKKAEKVKQYLLKKGLFDKDYSIWKDKEFIGFPIKENGDLKKRFGFIQFSDKKLKKTKKLGLTEILKGKLTKNEFSHLKTAYDIVGNIAIIEISKELEKKQEIIADAVLKSNRNIKTVVKKAGIHEGTFRTQKMRHLAGVRTKETVHRENKVKLKLNIEKVYFSPRLCNERKRITSLVRPSESVLIMFSGCAPYNCVISKNTKAKEVYGIEINKVAHEYGLENIKLNRLTNVKLFCGDVKKIVPKLDKKFNRIIMPLPKSAEDFLDVALSAAKEKGIIHFYDFLEEKDIPNKAVEKIKKACKKAKKKCTILHYNKCGQFSPKVFRVCVDFRV